MVFKFTLPLAQISQLFQVSICTNPSPQLLNPGQTLCAVSEEVQKFFSTGVFDLFSSVEPQAFKEHCADQGG